MHLLRHPVRPLRAGRHRARRGQLQRSARAEVPIAPSADLGDQARPIAGQAERALTIVVQRMRIIADLAARALTDLGRWVRTTPTTTAEQMPTIALVRTTPTTVAEQMPTIALVRTTLTTVAVQMPITALVRTTLTTVAERTPITVLVRTTP